jgi:hypothetical protein
VVDCFSGRRVRNRHVCKRKDDGLQITTTGNRKPVLS